jgi:hypothetical protein
MLSSEKFRKVPGKGRHDQKCQMEKYDRGYVEKSLGHLCSKSPPIVSQRNGSHWRVHSLYEEERVSGQKGHAFLPSLFSFLVTFYYSNSLLATLPKRSCFSDLLHIYFSNYSNRFSVLSIFISHNI